MILALRGYLFCVSPLAILGDIACGHPPSMGDLKHVDNFGYIDTLHKIQLKIFRRYYTESVLVEILCRIFSLMWFMLVDVPEALLLEGEEDRVALSLGFC